MGQKIKLLAFDVDGTFVNDKKEIPEENLEILRNLSEKGVKLILSTGRMPVSAKELTGDLKLGVHVSACNGGAMYVNDGSENFELIQAQYYDYDIIKSLLEYLDSLKIYYHFYEKDYIYTNRPKEIVKKFYNIFVKNMEAVKIVDSLSKVLTPDMNVLKAGVADDGTFDFEAVKAHLGRNPNLDVRLSHASYIDINPVGINKWEGLKAFMKYFDVAEDEIMYFGDHENDMECIEYAGFGVAMKNAMPHVKEKAKYVTEYDNNDAGMAKCIRKLLEDDVIVF